MTAMQPWAEKRRAEVIAEAWTAAGRPVPADIRATLQGEIID
jgi:hypothetical protein